MTIKNYEYAFQMAMRELEETSAEDLLAELKSYGEGPLGEVFSVPEESVKFRLDTRSSDRQSIEFNWSIEGFVPADVESTPNDAANDDSYVYSQAA